MSLLNFTVTVAGFLVGAVVAVLIGVPFVGLIFGWLLDTGSMERGTERMAAEPDLIEALRDLVKANEEWNAAVEASVGRPPKWTDGYLDRARAAIAKAGGDQEQ